MYKYLVIVAVIIALAFGVYYYREQSIHYCDMYNSMFANNKLLENRIEKEHKTALAISERNAELEKEALLDKSFDWNIHLPSGAILNRLHKDSN